MSGERWRYRVSSRVRDDDSYMHSERTEVFEVTDTRNGKVLEVFTGSRLSTSLGDTVDGTKHVSIDHDTNRIVVSEYDGSTRFIQLPEE